jgi:hypothetical protein
MKTLVRPESPFATRPESTYKSGKVVQTNGATSVEPGQCPEFDEYTLPLKGALHVETQEGNPVIHAG